VLVGRYQLEVPLGRGGSGEVWRGRDLATRRPVAVKLIALAAVDDVADVAETIGRFRRETMVLARLRHQNIVAALDAGRAGSELFLVMELADGVSLAGMIRQRAAHGMGLFPVPGVLSIAGQTCAGLAAAHAEGVVHRDIKPSNLMVTPRLGIKLVDFGIARLLADNSPRLTLPAHTVGTAAYISPEQAAAHDLDGRADLYSLGCVLYELLSGRPPFVASSTETLMMMQLTERAVPLGAIRPDLPAGLPELVSGLMEKDRAARPADAEAVIDRITAIGRVLPPGRPQESGASAHEADRETVRPRDGLAAPRDAGRPRQGGGERERLTNLTPERLGELAEPGSRRAPTLDAGVGRQPLPQQPLPQQPLPPPWWAPGGGDSGNGAETPSWPEPRRDHGRHRHRRRRWRAALGLLLTAAIVAGVGAYVWERNHHTFKVISVSVTPVPRWGKGCAVTVTFVGTIVTNGRGGRITYQWVQGSDPRSRLTVSDASGEDTIQVPPLTWPLHDQGRYPVELDVLAPGAPPGHASFSYSCQA
jgi:serine/threonine protein kinase